MVRSQPQQSEKDCLARLHLVSLLVVVCSDCEPAPLPQWKQEAGLKPITYKRKRILGVEFLEQNE